MIAVLLAAGRGRKFWPYGEVRNKCVFPIGNVPAVRRLALQLLDAGAEGLVVVVGWQHRSVRAALAGMEEHVRFVEQPAPEGTADAVLHALPLVGDAPFVVAAGDLVTTPETIGAFLRQAAAGTAPALALAAPLEHDRPGDWITSHLRSGRLERFEGHGREGSHRLAGLYAFQPDALPYLRATPGVMTHVPVGGMPPLEAELAETLATMGDAGLPTAALEPRGFALDLDKPWHALEANEAVLADLAARGGASEVADGARVAESAEIHGRVWLAPGATIGERVVVRGDLWLAPGASVLNGAIVEGPCMIGRGSTVRDYALLGWNTVLGPEAICGHGSEFEGTLLEGSYLYHYCEVFGILGARVDIGAATVCGTLRFDDSETVHRVGGRPEVPRRGANASYLGDYSRTGVNAILMPGVKTGPYSAVGPGVVLYEDLPEREVVLLKQDLVRRPWGPERYGW